MSQNFVLDANLLRVQSATYILDAALLKTRTKSAILFAGTYKPAPLGRIDLSGDIDTELLAGEALIIIGIKGEV